MITRPEHSAYPTPYEAVGNPGMTKREEFAKAAMQGIIASRTGPCVGSSDFAWIADYAVDAADALINRLNKPEGDSQ